jgi:hypothetical protein
MAAARMVFSEHIGCIDQSHEDHAAHEEHDAKPHLMSAVCLYGAKITKIQLYQDTGGTQNVSQPESTEELQTALIYAGAPVGTGTRPGQVMAIGM